MEKRDYLVLTGIIIGTGIPLALMILVANRIISTPFT